MEQRQQQDYSQQQQHQVQQEPLTPGSPRRHKPPLDIDAALRLQSQASYVQEPARKSGPGSISGGCGLSGNCSASQHKEGAFSASTSLLDINSLAARSCKKPLLHHQNAANNYYPEQRFNYSNNNSFQNNTWRNNTYANNISVDYIDCLSNNDLGLGVGGTANGGSGWHSAAAATATSQSDREAGAVAAAAAQTTMRGIPSCRKHLSRFHRSQRIEPATAPASDSTSDGGSLRPPGPVPVVTSQPSTNEHSLATAPKEAAATSDQQQQPIATSQDSSGSLMTNDESGASQGDESNLLYDKNHHQQQQQQGASTTGVLYPISVSEVKKRTYFIGSVSQDSLLSPDELYRYFPSGRVSIFVSTWNQNRKRAPMNLNDLLLPDQLIYMPDIYAIGIQEAFSSQQDYLRDWEIELQTTLGPNHVLLHSCSLGVLHLSLFIRRDLIWFCSTPEESVYNSRSMPTNMIKTKGAVSIAFRFFGTSFMFTNCHFPAHEHRVKDRIDEYQRIINSIDLPKNLKLLKPRYLSNDSTARFDCVFFMGDLNFRLEHRTFDETIQILDDIFQSKEQSFEALTQNDELLKVMEKQQAFHGFDESQIKFPPTYKFLAQTNRYDRQTKRVPSYTDRILFRSKRQRHIKCLIYDWLPQLVSSDHKPVYCLFDVLIRPGHEQNVVGSLNAGLFQRTVYLEALKRRAEDPDGIRESGAGGNLICSIT